jgi:hypothetical protein
MSTAGFPWTDFLVNVGTLALLPGLITLAGNYWAIKDIDDPRRRRRIKAWFWALFLVSFGLTIFQQYRVAVADQSRPNLIVEAIRAAFPGLGKPQPQQPSQSQSQPTSRGYGPTLRKFANITNERLSDMAKAELRELSELAAAWNADNLQIERGLNERLAFTKIADGNGGWRQMNKAEIASSAEEAKRTKAQLATETRAKTKTLMLRACDLRTEILSRLETWEGADWLPNKRNDDLFAKIRAGDYGPDEVREAYEYLNKIQQRLEAKATIG